MKKLYYLLFKPKVYKRTKSLNKYVIAKKKAILEIDRLRKDSQRLIDFLTSPNVQFNDYRLCIHYNNYIDRNDERIKELKKQFKIT